jgi:hypothetical protein
MTLINGIILPLNIVSILLCQPNVVSLDFSVHGANPVAGNVYVYDGLGFRSASLSALLNEIKKTKLQIYTEPQAGINILL